jgi:hypothetical protein
MATATATATRRTAKSAPGRKASTRATRKGGKAEFPRRVPHRTAKVTFQGETMERTIHRIWESAPGRATGMIKVNGEERNASLKGGKWSIGSVIK